MRGPAMEGLVESSKGFYKPGEDDVLTHSSPFFYLHSGANSVATILNSSRCRRVTARPTKF
jgi:hypothetical protein